MRHDLRIDVAFADPTGDQLGVLRTEVYDEDGPGTVRRPGDVRQWPIPTRCAVWYVFPSVLIEGATTSSAFWNSRIVA